MTSKVITRVHHIEHHFKGSETIRDIVIGMSDGLTVPFALAAGLSGAIDSTHIIITAGLAEIAAGSIAMGLGGYLAAKSDADHYASERRREEAEVDEKPEAEAEEVDEILQNYGLKPEESRAIVNTLRTRRGAWIDFMMRFELGLEAPEPGRAFSSAATIGGSYIVGGLVPLSPYFFFATARQGFPISGIVTLSALLVFGCVKGHYTGTPPLRSGLQTLLIGGLAAGAAFILAKLIS